MTYNIRGRAPGVDPIHEVIEVIETISPDILIIQEASEFRDADNVHHSDVKNIVESVASVRHAYFGPTVGTQQDIRIENRLFVDSIFSDWQAWDKGNAILSRWELARLGDPAKCGTPRNVPLYQTPLYQGTRDTEPRYALIARIRKAPFYPFVVGVHLTTLSAERVQAQDMASFSNKATEKAQLLRLKQAKRLVDLLTRHVLERREVVFLLGDFNAIASEPCIRLVLESEGGFMRLQPSQGPTSTHAEVPGVIDHILVYPQDKVLEYQCRVVDSPIARKASDHLPVVADVKIG